jgi:hypothetical protein
MIGDQQGEIVDAEMLLVMRQTIAEALAREEVSRPQAA